MGSDEDSMTTVLILVIVGALLIEIAAYIVNRKRKLQLNEIHMLLAKRQEILDEIEESLMERKRLLEVLEAQLREKYE
jgi:hypothetical protein